MRKWKFLKGLWLVWVLMTCLIQSGPAADQEQSRMAADSGEPLLSAFLALSGGQDSSSLTAAEVRKVIADGNRRWGNARVEYDKKTYEEMLSPDFYVLVQGRKLTRQEFIDAISVQRPGVKLTRFDATVLTVQQSEGIWVAVIHEKLEIDSPDGKVYSLWITRDGWKKVNDRWFITFSEAISFEQWRGGEKPPFLDW